MSFSIENVVIQTNKPRLTKDKIKILQRLRRPETLHTVYFLGICGCDVVDGGASDVCSGIALDVLKHVPGVVLEYCVACYAVKDEEGFDGFWSADIC